MQIRVEIAPLVADIFKANPIFHDPKFQKSLEFWSDVENAIIDSFPRLSEDERAVVIGRVIQDLTNAK